MPPGYDPRRARCAGWRNTAGSNPAQVDELHPEKIILFGSYANGAPTPDSDVDLLIIMETEAPSKERSWAVSRLLLPRPFPVDILVRTPREIATALERGDFFIREIISHGKVLYERCQ